MATRLRFGRRTINCPHCDERLISVRGRVTIFRGPQPLEFTARPAEEMGLLVCHVCGALVPVDHDLVRIF